MSDETVHVALHDAIAEVAKWARLPTDVAGRGKSGEAQGAQPRHVHAKVYRLWRKGGADPGQRPRETDPSMVPTSLLESGVEGICLRQLNRSECSGSEPVGTQLRDALPKHR